MIRYSLLRHFFHYLLWGLWSQIESYHRDARLKHGNKYRHAAAKAWKYKILYRSNGKVDLSKDS